MRILITNDDGVHATQLPALIRFCMGLGEVTTVVPKEEQSGKSHGIELHAPFEAVQTELEPGITVWTVDSTPADCVRFAILGLREQYDLVVSGINCGFNIGTDVSYSGTVGAACEAVLLGVPALAFSTSAEYYEHAARHLGMIFEYVWKNKLLEIHPIYNINIPPNKGQFRITRQGGPYYSDDYIHAGGNMYQAAGKCVHENRGDLLLDTDATINGYISILPVTVDKTDLNVFRKLNQL